jgi:hypothetical protein
LFLPHHVADQHSVEDDHAKQCKGGVVTMERLNWVQVETQSEESCTWAR